MIALADQPTAVQTYVRGALLSPRASWDACENAWTMMRVATWIGVPRPVRVLAACACARAMLHLTREQDRAVCERAIVTAERWTRGEATREECRNAADASAYAAYAAAYAAADASAYAAYAAAYAAADASAYAAAYAAADASAYAADAAYAASRQSARVRIAEIVRSVIPWNTIKPLWEAWVHASAVDAITTRMLGKSSSACKRRAFDDAYLAGDFAVLVPRVVEVWASNCCSDENIDQALGQVSQ